MQARDRARWAGGDGIVIIFHTVQFPDKLNPVLHSRECARNLVDIFFCRKPLNSAGGGHIVFDIVDTRDADIRSGHDPLPISVNHAVFQIYAVFRLCLPGEVLHCSVCISCKTARNSIVVIQNNLSGFTLMRKDVFLGLHILCHVLMHIQMVRGHVRHNGNIG